MSFDQLPTTEVNIEIDVTTLGGVVFLPLEGRIESMIRENITAWLMAEWVSPNSVEVPLSDPKAWQSFERYETSLSN